MDQYYMKRALKLAGKGRGWTSPNPLVGAVIVKDGQIVGEGYHKRFGEDHAEINAINNASESIVGATLYVTLEPCSHYGKTPPCVERIIKEKLSRVVIGVTDPNPLVAGRSIAMLQDQGITTTVGILEKECRELNEAFFKYMTTKIPFVTVKYAQTVDGRIATTTGHSRWISSQASRKYAHRLRSYHDGILVGIKTVLKDDPDLTVRLVKGKNPQRIVVDSTLQIPADAKILTNQDKAPTIVATTSHCSSEKRALLREMDIETLVIDEDDGGHVDLHKLIAELGRRGISSILVEGGAEIITSLVKEKIPDRLLIITAPKIAGKGIEAIGNLGLETMDDSVRLTFKRVFRKGDDVVFDARIER
jgi:diaminohydroxyphosphoribosylaminopyrimidine deaminase/5-amino-6-(5-phosphoribosylamino)uracil reductase